MKPQPFCDQWEARLIPGLCGNIGEKKTHAHKPRPPNRCMQRSHPDTAYLDFDLYHMLVFLGTDCLEPLALSSISSWLHCEASISFRSGSIVVGQCCRLPDFHACAPPPDYPLSWQVTTAVHVNFERSCEPYTACTPVFLGSKLPRTLVR